MKLRISAISFLNTAPLMWDFEHPESAQRDLQAEFDIAYTVPSACADALRSGSADIGIIPAITYQAIPDLVVIPEIAIASNGPVRSILVVSNKPLDQIKTLAADTSSRTSVVLTKIMFQKWWQPESSGPEFIPVEPDLKTMLARCDAALLIGDPALTVELSKYALAVDLGEEWTRRTGKPFVYAFWAVRQAALANHPLAESLASIFQRSRDHGLAHVAEIAQEWAPRLGIDKAGIRDYLLGNMRYGFDQEQMAGLNLFFTLASEVGVMQQVRSLNFIASRSVSCR
ncbi:MAG TPA: menaquinone biosynthesis protein [Terriglobales bacterium]|jgi:chorismate dehydratase|nr:menaquinone biosynthesis protein [Terriglobales bacterium]